MINYQLIEKILKKKVTKLDDNTIEEFVNKFTNLKKLKGYNGKKWKLKALKDIFPNGNINYTSNKENLKTQILLYLKSNKKNIQFNSIENSDFLQTIDSIITLIENNPLNQFLQLEETFNQFLFDIDNYIQNSNNIISFFENQIVDFYNKFKEKLSEKKKKIEKINEMIENLNTQYSKITQKIERSSNIIRNYTTKLQKLLKNEK